ncbi:MAG: hypothetical protein K2X93_04695 [Candidatus Obscuribacterales bacterium]|nr:hypothetical protein [Candidatus Obscuribacterales bacterium]
MNIQPDKQAVTNLEAADPSSTESVKLVVSRLLWASFTALLCWGALVATLAMVNLPQLTPAGDSQGETSLVGCRIAAFILIINFLSVFLVNLLAPLHVLRARLISNTIFGGLILAILTALTLISKVLPANTYTIFKGAVKTVYDPSFLTANLISSALCALIVYFFRGVRLADMTEVYWSLGLMFLFGLAVSLVSMIVAG